MSGPHHRTSGSRGRTDRGPACHATGRLHLEIPATVLNKLLIATTNPGKLEEFRQLLEGLVPTIISSADVDAPEVVEDAPTLEGNALKKARALFEHSGLPALADDTGLEVRTLDGRPGVHSARYAGPDCIAADNVAKLLNELRNREDRSARFRTAIVYFDGAQPRVYEGICTGRIIERPRGAGGFGYDPVFLPDGETETFAELSADRKNAISHRGRAMQAFLNDLKSW
ncbi:MAG: RdgB/HAM1 family non-canonical purine NTP pyrophosphatase [Rhodothermales bacterium]|nr:RdgB/HAM1 family non-canonical purine NTP pyrophosphatase [Rhodothermales bacterium]